MTFFKADLSVKEEATRRFKAWQAGDQIELPPYLRRAVFSIILANEPTDADYDTILDTYKTSQSADGKEIALSVIGLVTRPELIKRTIEFVLSGQISPQDIHGPCNSLAMNPKARNIWWETMKEHWP